MEVSSVSQPDSKSHWDMESGPLLLDSRTLAHRTVVGLFHSDNMIHYCMRYTLWMHSADNSFQQDRFGSL